MPLNFSGRAMDLGSISIFPVVHIIFIVAKCPDIKGALSLILI